MQVDSSQRIDEIGHLLTRMHKGLSSLYQQIEASIEDYLSDNDN